jgi:hypothetical protein
MMVNVFMKTLSANTKAVSKVYNERGALKLAWIIFTNTAIIDGGVYVRLFVCVSVLFSTGQHSRAEWLSPFPARDVKHLLEH